MFHFNTRRVLHLFRQNTYTTRLHFFQISTGVGAGNLGDEMMARAFWQALPPGWCGEVELFPMAGRYRGSYPSRHIYTPVEAGRFREAAKRGVTGLLACGTPVHEMEGLHFPLRFIAERLDAFHSSGTPVHAVGVGVDRLYTRRGRAMFQKSFLPIRSWTVRNEACCEALLDLEVPPERIVVGADWAWLYRATDDRRDWAEQQWRSLGIDPARPLLAANLVNLVWRKKTDAKRAIAEALDRAASTLGLQIAFLCNECREGEVFDSAAAREISALMKSPTVLVPNEYWSVDEMLGLLSHVDVTLGMRYHIGVMSCMAGASPVLISRSQKILGLASDLGTSAIRLRECDADRVYAGVESALSEATQTMVMQNEGRKALETRAGLNLSSIAYIAGLSSR
jgi:polysaccharide pyruvyl transferase WcaK-like protein